MAWPLFILDAPIDRRNVETWIDIQLAPTISPGGVVILENVCCWNGKKSGQTVKA
jgi:hypothetical protein